jgi:hypothetical protein
LGSPSVQILTPNLERPVSALDRRPGWCLLILALLFAVQVSAYWYPTPDASGYLSMARSLARGEGLRNLGSGQLYLAPGYPVLVSPAFLVGDQPFLVLSLVNAGLAGLLMLGIYTWARRQVPAAALLVTAVALVNVDLWALYRRTLSEMAFMALLMWVINALHWACATTSRPSRIGRTVLAAGLMICLVTVRQAGLTVAAGFGTVMLFEAWRARVPWGRALGMALAVGVPACVAVLGLAVYDRLMAAPSGAATYAGQIIDPTTTWAGQLLEGLRLRISEIGRVTIPGMFKAYGRRGQWLHPTMAIYLPLLLLLLAGWWRLVGRTRDVLALTLPFYLGLYVVWPFDQATRFTVPMIPLLLACLWSMLEPLRTCRFRIMGALLAGHLGVAAGYWVAVDWPRARADQAQWAPLRQVAASLRAEGGPVLVEELPANAPWMLQLALDRRVREHMPGAPIDPDVHWIVTLEPDSAYEGFSLHSRAGKYRVWCRDPEVQARQCPGAEPVVR